MKTNSFSIQKNIIYTLFVVLISTFYSCGSYQNVSYHDSDGIYGTADNQRRETANSQNNGYKDYFGSLQEKKEQPEVFTDVENYNSSDSSNSDSSWGQNNENISNSVYDNSWGAGWNGWGMGMNNWGMGMNNWGMGWNNWGWNGFNGPGFYGWGCDPWFGCNLGWGMNNWGMNGFYGNSWANGNTNYYPPRSGTRNSSYRNSADYSYNGRNNGNSYNGRTTRNSNNEVRTTNSNSRNNNFSNTRNQNNNFNNSRNNSTRNNNYSSPRNSNSSPRSSNMNSGRNSGGGGFNNGGSSGGRSSGGRR